MRIIVKQSPILAEELRSMDIDEKEAYDLGCELSTDWDGSENWVDIDDEVNMFVKALRISGYYPESIFKGFKRWLENHPEYE